MKIKSVLMMLSVASIMMACDKEDSGSKTVDFAGSYKGYTLASCNYFQNMISADETVVITKNTDGSASVSFTSATWGTFTITDAQASISGNVCSLSGSGQTQMGMGGSTSAYDCTFTAEIKSQTDARMEFSIPAVMGGMTLTFQTGDAPADLLLAGTYEGYTDADCAMFQDRYTDGESVKLTANGDGSVKVVFESDLWGTFTVESATATKEGEEYVFTGSGSVAMGMGESTSNYDFTLSGRTNAAKDDFSIAFNVPAVMGGLTVTLLPGTAPTTEE
ncbi:calycin-like domain-containing protein [uncultured Alistipes sp.]|mgnify:FL=1|uniref:calycin-like domain-containing protein n=1 Tax=uncultured Alistipes sp. TaxID=538949 RepID=UPI00266C1A91|nr:calycin-like domain-containing protein [uncultured Alistipes sp.]